MNIFFFVIFFFRSLFSSLGSLPLSLFSRISHSSIDIDLTYIRWCNKHSWTRDNAQTIACAGAYSFRANDLHHLNPPLFVASLLVKWPIGSTVSYKKLFLCIFFFFCVYFSLHSFFLEFPSYFGVTLRSPRIVLVVVRSLKKSHKIARWW